MELATLQVPRAGWSAAAFPALDSERTLIILFGAPAFADDSEFFAALQRAYPRSQSIGCSTAGEIFGTSLSDDSVALAVLRFDGTTVASAFAPVASAADSFAAGACLAEQLYQPSLRGVFVLSDGLTVNGSELVRGLNSRLPAATIVTGGLAGDGDAFRKTWVLWHGRPESGVVSAIGLYGDQVRLGHGSKGGWDIFGPERRVTRSTGSTLYELDGKPALELYKTYLGERAAALPASALLFPLSLRRDAADEKRIVRTVLSVDETGQSLTFAGDIGAGHLAQLMRANFDRLIDGASDAALSARGQLEQTGPVLSLAVSCVGRRLVLGERAEEELEATLEVLPAGTRQVGFYSYGEISPYATGHCDLHNQTMTLTTISEN